MESIRHLHCNFCSPQFSEGLCVQDKQESTLVLQDEKKARMMAQAELHSTVQLTTSVAHKGAQMYNQAIWSGTTRPYRLNLQDRWPGALIVTDGTQETLTFQGTLLLEVCLAALGSCRGIHLGEHSARTICQSTSNSVLWFRKYT